MKFYIRRAVLGIVGIPFVAGAWVFVYLSFLLMGAEPSQTLTDTFANGITIGIIVAVMLTFSPQVSKVLDKIVGA